MKNRIFFLLGSIATLSFCASAYIDDHPLQGYQEATGNVINKTSYANSDEKHTVIQTETGYYKSTPQPKYPDEVCMNNEIHVYDYIEKEKAMPDLSWKLYDYIHDCQTSARLEFTKDSPLITDLDSDGKKEVWISYYKGCHGDVSPDELKVFMYRDGAKHSMRGQTHLFVDGSFCGGDFKMDKTMSTADKKFRDFGVNLFRRLAEDKN
jgi:hypothetical protein